MGITYPSKALEYIKRLTDTRVPTESITKVPVHKIEPKNSATEQPFERAKPEDVGIPSSRIAEFLRELYENRDLDMHGVTIIKDGKLIAQAMFGPYEADLPQTTFSECKSVISLAIGILIGEKRLSLDEKVVDIIDDINAITKKRYEKLTVEGLLTMRSSSYFNEIGAVIEEDWEKEFFTLVPFGTIGKTFFYNSLNTYMLACIVRRKSGMTVTEFLRPRLFEPLGIKNIFWEKGPSGTECGGWGLYILPEDMAKLGQLALDGGVWNGKQLVPKGYIKLATKAHAKVPEDYGDFDYGYQIWVGRNSDSFLYNGLFGQNMMCFRNTKTIVTANAGNCEFFQQSPFCRICEKYFSSEEPTVTVREDTPSLPEMIKRLKKKDFRTEGLFAARRDKKLAEDMREKLDGRFCILPEDKKTTISIFPVALQVCGNTYGKGLEKIGFEIKDGKFIVSFFEGDDIISVPVGFSNYEKSELCLGDRIKFKVAAHGRFAENEDYLPVLKLKFDFIETPCSKTVKLIFDGDRVCYTQEEFPGAKFIKYGINFISDNFLSKGIFGKMSLDEKFSDAEYLAYKAEAKLSARADFNLV